MKPYRKGSNKTNKKIKCHKYKISRTHKNKLQKMHITEQDGGVNELISEEFIRSMYDNMWQFMNEDTITFVLKEAKCPKKFTYKSDINDDTFGRRYINTVCLKGPREQGHYIFIDKDGKVWGTYEMKILYKDDDGICHGFAMAAALQSCGLLIGSIHPNPRTKAHRYQNYITVFRTYAYIINNGWWDKALHKYFYGDVEWIDEDKSVQTKTSLAEINKFIEDVSSKL